MLDRLHEETKDFYVSNELETSKSKQEIDWNETRDGGKVVTDKSFYNLRNSVIRDIFGGLMREEYRKANSRNVNVKLVPFFVVQLDIPYDDCKLDDCMDEYFKQQEVQGFEENGKAVKLQKYELFDKLPNVLIIQFRRFIFKEQLIKKKEFVNFSDILEIKDNHVSPMLKMGVFKKASGKAKQNRRYRLFSVVEHRGNYAHKGHYVCYSLDSAN